MSYLQKESERTPRPVLFALLSEESEALMRRVLRAGADEVLFGPLAQGDLMRPLLKVSEALRRSVRRAGGKIFSVASLGGGVGVTTLCANLGRGAAWATGGVRVVLVDLDLQEGGLGHLFGAEPERGILALARLDRKPDSISLEAALTKHASGLYVLGAPARIEDSEEVSDTTVGNLLDLLRQLFDYIVIDCGDHVDENSVAAWERSEEVLYVLEQSVTATHRAVRFLELFRAAGDRRDRTAAGAQPLSAGPSDRRGADRHNTQVPDLRAHSARRTGDGKISGDGADALADGAQLRVGARLRGTREPPRRQRGSHGRSRVAPGARVCHLAAGLARCSCLREKRSETNRQDITGQ